MKNFYKSIVLLLLVFSLMAAYAFENSAEHLSTHDDVKCTSLFHHAIGFDEVPNLDVVHSIDQSFVVALFQEENKLSSRFEKFPFKNKAPPKTH